MADMVEFQAQVSGYEMTKKANRIQPWQHLSDWQLADRFQRDSCPTLTELMLQWAARARVGEPGLLQKLTQCDASNVHSAGSSRSLARNIQDATGSRGQVLSV